MSTNTVEYPSGVGALVAELCKSVSGRLLMEIRQHTEKPGLAVNASAVSGVGTGPAPVGWGEQFPRLVSDLLGRTVVMGSIGAGAAFAGLLDVTSSGAETRTGSAAAIT